MKWPGRVLRGMVRRHCSRIRSGKLPETRFRIRKDQLRLNGVTMAEGTIKRLTDKGFGFIDMGTGKDLFFHMSALQGVRFDDLREGQRVSFTEGRGPKGPNAENVRPV